MTTTDGDKARAEAYRKAGWRLATPGTRSPIVAPVTRFLLGLPVFLLPTQTADYFAWTIAVPMTAVFLGANYWSAALLAVLASRRPLWCQTRISISVALVFAPLVTAATFIHLDQFHTDQPIGIIWVVAYGLYVPLLMVMLWRQLQEPGGDPPRQMPLAGWVRAVLAANALIEIPLGIGLFVAPGSFDSLWPWPLTDLTSQICGAWVLAFGVLAGHMLVENDVDRVRIALVCYPAFGLLQGISLARYGDDLSWDQPSAWVFVAVVASTLALGAYGWLVARDAPIPEPGSG